MLKLHRSERADALVEALGDVLSDGLPDPMEAEVISVPTRGVERWLSQRLSARLGTSTGRADGVCANIEFPFPGRLIGGAVAVASGVERDTDPWLPERAVWPLLDLLDECLEEPWLATVAGHLGSTDADPPAGGDPRRSRRFSTARHVTDLYDRYAVHRPGMIWSWAAKADVDGAGKPLPPDTAWQAELWRRLRDRLGTPGPAERLGEACGRLRDDPGLAALPGRLSLFGLTGLAASYLQVLRALAVHRDVHLFLLHPSHALWDRTGELIGGTDGPVRRGDDPTAGLPRDPLLASWGRDAREMQLILGGGDRTAAATDEHRPLPVRPPDTLLRRIQADIRADAAPPGDPLPRCEDHRPVLDPSDRSIQVHACHGRARQVEVVRDAILHLLVEDPSLEARDVIVMCPDIEAFAPLIHATFGAGDADAFDIDGGDEEQPAGDASSARPPDLRVRLADRALRQTNPVLGAVSNLLALADARVTASQVLDFAGRDPVRRRFRFDDDELARIEEWVAATGIRWGLDAQHRAPFKLDGVGENTWRAGLDRVLLGVAMAEEDQRLVGGVLPLDDVDSSAIELAGRFAEVVDRLHSALGSLAGPLAVTAWAKAIATAADALTATSDTGAWQRAQLQRLLDDMVAEASVDGTPSATELELSEIRSLLASRLRGRPTTTNFRTGHLTICTLVPMRSVPHRVVCLVGLDDGAFPRRTERDGDDLVLADPHVGDRDGPSEDRQLLLDALLAATGHLVITYAGRDERTNAERPPAVPVGELLDVIDRTVRLGDMVAKRAAARDRIVVHHPLQPFDERNFIAGRLVAPAVRPWSFDATTLEGARALAGERAPRQPFLAAALPSVASDVVELDQVIRFVQHPVKAFLRQRLGIFVGDRSNQISDTLPVDLDPLEQWGVGDRILEARLAGAGMDECLAAERARGHLPPGALSGRMLDRICATVDTLVAATAAVVPAGEPDTVEISVRLDDGRLLVGTVPGVVGRTSRMVTYSRVAPKHRLAAWARFLALAAAHPRGGFEVVTIGRRRGDGPGRFDITVARLAPAAVEAVTARRYLHDLVALYDRGLCEPLPVYCATSAAYATAVTRGTGAEAAARKAWQSGRYPGEDKDLEHRLVLDGVRPFEDLLVAPPCEGEDADGWEQAESSRFGRYALRAWSGLLAAETLEDE